MGDNAMDDRVILLRKSHLSMPIYHYTAYSLTIQSQLVLPELLPATNGQSRCDDWVWREVPTALSNPSGSYGIWEAVPGKFLLGITDIARYLILGGQENLDRACLWKYR